MIYDRANDPPLPTLETARLRLVPVNSDHAEGLFAIYSDARNVRYWDTPPHPNLLYTKRIMVNQIKHYRPGSWTIFLRATGKIIGAMLVDVGVMPSMGYIIRARDWRKGYATEVMTAALDHLFTRAGIDQMELWIMADNFASQQLALKLGFSQRRKFHQKFDHLPQMHETLIYGLRAEDWWARRR